VNAKRVYLLTFVFLILFLILLARGLFLSVQGDQTDNLPNKKYQIASTRGIIYDANGIPLVNNLQKTYYYFDIAYYKRVLELGRVNEKKIYEQLESLFDITESELKSRFIGPNIMRVGTNDGDPMSIPKPLSIFISYDTVSIRNSLYPFMNQIIGKTDSFGGGINGIEKQFNKVLSPKSEGEIDYENFEIYNRLGEIRDIVEPENGKPVQLSIDLRMQKLLYSTLEKTREQFDAESAQGVLMETKTGKIVGMYSTLGWEAPIMSVYEPGSAMKPFTFAMALKYNILEMDRMFHCTGKVKPFADLPTIINCTHVHGDINTTEALSQSCNVATVEIALDVLEEMGNWTFYDELKTLGFGSKSGIEMPGEVNGILHSPNDWNRLTGIQMGIGQGIAVTAVQLCAAMNTIANDGYYISPTILAQRENEENYHKVYQEDVIEKLHGMMIETVKTGTGLEAQVKGLTVAAKTGTAQKAGPGGYVDGKYVSSFIGFFPAENPVYTLLISVDEPKGDLYYGGDVAAPAFREITSGIIDLITTPEQTLPEKILVQTWKLPDFTNYTKKDVYDIVENLDISISQVEIRGEGIVKEQFPAAGTSIEDIDRVVLILDSAEVD